MADGQDEFRAAQRDRVLPTCPPQTSLDNKHQRCTFDRSYRPSDGRGKVRNFTLCDHGAVFGVVRWTNLYFKVKLAAVTPAFVIAERVVGS